MVTKDYTDINLELFLFPYNCRSVIIVFQLSPFFKKTQTLSTIFFINNDGTKKKSAGKHVQKKGTHWWGSSLETFSDINSELLKLDYRFNDFDAKKYWVLICQFQDVVMNFCSSLLIIEQNNLNSWNQSSVIWYYW